MVIACVLHTGLFLNRGKKLEYRPEHVQWLKRQCDKYAPGQGFVCLSNVPIEGVDVIPIKHDWPGWWSKMELFHHFDEAFYIDLDTVLVGDISDMVAYPHNFTALKNLSGHNSIGSGLMAWRGDYSFLYDEFKENPQKHMKDYTTSERWGDQGFIGERQKCEHFQNLFPNRLVSFKFNMKMQGNPPRGCSIVCFHGKPKPWEVEREWIM